MTYPCVSQKKPWYRQAAAVIPRHLVLKSTVTTGFISVFFAAYFYLLRHPAYPTTLMPVTALDRLIGFEPLALPLYVSLWVYVSILPVFFGTRRELLLYGLSMTLMCVIGLSIFYFWPTAAPAPDINWTQYPDMDLLKNIDASGNACPSLHVATAFFSGFWFHRLLRRFGGPMWILMLNWTWCIGIIYSTLAIRQHVAVDVAAGLVLGGAGCLAVHVLPSAVAGRIAPSHAARRPAMNLSATAFVKHLISRAAAPYKSSGTLAWHFACGKLGGDPVFVHLLAAGLLMGRARILDIGCGQGLLTSWLLAAQASAAHGEWPAVWPAAPQASLVRGIELMARDVTRAERALIQAVNAGQAEFVQADMCSSDFGQTDAVVILDVLHYVPFAAQDDVLQRVRQSLAPGGVLLLRVGDAAAGLPFAISNWVDHAVTRLRGHRLGTLYCRPLAAWKTALQKLGFVVEALAMSQGTPFANVLLVARLPPAS